MKGTIGIIAGNGQLPFLVAAGIRKAGHRVVAIGHFSETRKDLARQVDILHWVHIGELGKIIDFLLKEKAQTALFAGGVAKTHFFSRARPDARAIQVLSRLHDKKDNALLRAIADEVEREGIRVKSLVPFLKENMASKGCWTKRKPSEREMNDVCFGWKMAKRAGRLDIGQSIVVKDQIVLALEAIEGTDETIRRGGKWGRGDVVVVKVCKPRQDPRLDLPVIGLSTVRTLQQAGASAMAVEAGKTIIIDKEKVISGADRNRLCLMGV